MKKPLFFLLIFPLLVFSQTHPIYSVDEFEKVSTEGNIKAPFINALEEDSSGFLWLGGTSGLKRFDGDRFTKIPLITNTGRELSKCIRQLLAINKDTLLVATTYGLGIVNTKTLDINALFFNSTDTSYFLEDNFIRWIVKGKEGTLWIFTRTAVHLLDHQLKPLGKVQLDKHPNVIYAHPISPICFPINKYELHINALNFDRTNNRKKWFKININTKTILPAKIPFVNNFNVGGSTQISQDKFILGGNTDGKKSMFFYYFNPTTNNFKKILKYDSSDKVVLNGRFPKQIKKQSGIAFFRYKTGYFFDTISKKIAEEYRNFIPYTRFKKMKNGVVYAGNTEGLFRLNKRSSSFSTIPVYDSLFKKIKFNDYITDFLKHKEKLYIATHGKDLFVYDIKQKKIEHILITGKEGSADMLWNIRLLDKKTIWIGTQNGLFLHNIITKKNKRWKHKNLPDAIHNYPITTQFIDSKGILWMGLGFGNGILAFNAKKNTIKHYLYDKNKFPLRSVLGITEDKNKNLWMGYSSGGGLIRWNRATDSFTKIRIDKNSHIYSDQIDDLLIDHHNKLWIATRQGLYVYTIENNSFEEITRDKGMADNYINKLYQDKNNNIWMATMTGLSVLQYKTKRVWNFTQKDGIPGLECGVIKPWNKEGDTLFIGSRNGFCLLNINTIIPVDKTLQCYIEPLRINNKIIHTSLDKQLELNYKQNNIKVNFGTINHEEGGGNRYYYRLNKINNAWIELKNKGELILSGLGPNSYNLQLKVCVNGANCIESKPINFVIKEPFWKSIWFLLTLLFTAVALTAIFYKIRIFNLHRIEKLRRQISTDLHDDVGASISSVRILTDFLTNKEEGSKSSKHQIIHTIKEQTSHISEVLEEIVWNINPKNDRLANIINRMQQFANETLENSDILLEWQVHIHQYNKLINANKRKELYLFFKEAIHNIAKHAQCKHSWITIKTVPQRIEIMIKDDGIGFNSENTYYSNGLESMKNRAKNLDASLKINSSIGKGTTIVLICPL